MFTNKYKMYKNIDLPLKKLHLSARYSLNADDLVDIMTKSFQTILSKEDDKKKLQYLSQEMFYDILSETLDLDKYLNDRTKYHDVIKKFSFENKFIDQKYGDTGKALDSVSFKFFDYVYSCTKQQQPDEEKKLFSDWPYRVPQMLFIQKGQLWILNMLNNTAKWADGKSQEEIDNGLKDFIRESLDKDFSPYYGKLSNTEMQDTIKGISNNGVKVRDKYMEGSNPPSTFVVNENRMLGFEIEAQFKDDQANEIFKGDFKSKSDNPWNKMLNIIHEAFTESDYEKFKNSSFISKDSEIIKEHGSIIREGSVIREDGYIVFEYSSPIAKNGINEIKEDINALSSLFKDNGVAVTDDAGTHLHVSIEDILPKESDDEKTKQEKLEAAKRIFVNYILIQDKIEQIIPEHRRSDHFWFSSQTFESYVKDDKDLIIGLIDSAKSYEELRETLMVGGKYLPIAAFKDNIEFRCFPATTSAETMNTWFELLNTFVNNSIKGLPSEECLDEQLYSKLQDLTKNGTYVEDRIGKRNLDLEHCNRFSETYVTQEKKEYILDYTRDLLISALKDGVPNDPLLTFMPISVDPDRQPGNVPEIIVKQETIDDLKRDNEYDKTINMINDKKQEAKKKLLQDKPQQIIETQTRGQKQVAQIIEDEFEQLNTKRQDVQKEQEQEKEHQPKEIIPDSQSIIKLRQMFKDADKKVDDSKDSNTKTSNSPSIGI